MEFTILLLVLLYLPSGAGLKCYLCRSSNKMNCIAKQKERQCRRHTDVCVTLEFTQVVYLSAKTTNVIRGYRKHCASRRFNCKSYCRRRLEMGYATCKAKCCTRNLCNKFTTKMVKYGSSSGGNTKHWSAIMLFTALLWKQLAN